MCEKALGQFAGESLVSLLISFFVGLIAGCCLVLFVPFVPEKSHRNALVRGEPNSFVLDPPRSKKKIDVSERDVPSRQALAAARMRARKISSGPRSSSLERDSDVA